MESFLRDSHGRQIRDLRVSLTDRCNFRCFYCLPNGEPPLARKETILTFEELEYICEIFVALGIEKIRLTGGEPLIRKDVEKLVAKLARLKDGLRITNYECLKKIFAFVVLLLAVYCLPLAAYAQKLDNMTADEDTFIRDADEMDTRMDIYVHIVDRRFLALTDPNAAQSKQAQKDLENYGKLRTGNRFKLLSDIEKTLAY